MKHIPPIFALEYIQNIRSCGELDKTRKLFIDHLYQNGKEKKKIFFPFCVYLRKHLKGTWSKLESDEFVVYIYKIGPSA